VGKIVKLAMLLTLAGASPAVAGSPCPPSKFQPPYPWFISEPMSGDKYADVYLDIDKAGRAINCRLGRSNLYGDEGFFICNAFKEQWRTSPRANDRAVGPPPANLPPNSPIKATVHRQFISYGDKHAKAEREARKKFFLDHPEERPDCYPDAD